VNPYNSEAFMQSVDRASRYMIEDPEFKSGRDAARAEDSGERPFHHDKGKPEPLSISAPRAATELGRVFAYGRNKYPDVDGQSNWWHYRYDWKYRDLLQSAVRHLEAFASGEDYDAGNPADPKDNGSGLHHLAHCMANCAMLFEVLDYADDDRNLDRDQ
jgi:hypothetical protein